MLHQLERGNRQPASDPSTRHRQEPRRRGLLNANPDRVRADGQLNDRLRACAIRTRISVWRARRHRMQNVVDKNGKEAGRLSGHWTQVREQRKLRARFAADRVCGYARDTGLQNSKGVASRRDSGISELLRAAQVEVEGRGTFGREKDDNPELGPDS